MCQVSTPTWQRVSTRLPPGSVLGSVSMLGFDEDIDILHHVIRIWKVQAGKRGSEEFNRHLCNVLWRFQNALPMYSMGKTVFRAANEVAM